MSIRRAGYTGTLVDKFERTCAYTQLNTSTTRACRVPAPSTNHSEHHEKLNTDDNAGHLLYVQIQRVIMDVTPHTVHLTLTASGNYNKFDVWPIYWHPRCIVNKTACRPVTTLARSEIRINNMIRIKTGHVQLDSS